jgi:prolyl oligopeptidase
MAFEYPQFKKLDTKYSLHGKTITDPFSWLEDPDAPDTETFVQEQNILSSRIIASWPHRKQFQKALTEKFDYERFGCPFRVGRPTKLEDAKNTFYFYNSGLQAQSVLMQDDSTPKVFFDANQLSTDGTVSLSTYAFSESGKLFAYALSVSGSDWVKIKIKTISGTDLPDTLDWVKFTSIQWTHDDAGFFYNRYPKPNIEEKSAGTETDQNKDSATYYHRLGTTQDEDILIHKDVQNPTLFFGASVSEDGEWLLMSITESCDPRNKLWISKLNGSVTGMPVWKKVVDDFVTGEFDYITNVGSVFYFKTSANAPQYKIVKMDVEKGEFETVVPEWEKGVLKFASCVGGRFLVAYLMDVQHKAFVFGMQGTTDPEGETFVPIPTGSVIESITGRLVDEDVFIKYTNFLNPGVIMHYNVVSGKGEDFRVTKVKKYDQSQFVTKQIFYESKDGTKVPMFITSRKDVVWDGTNPTLLYGYGGFQISILPAFSPTWVTFMQHMRGVVCVANIRGGGEYGVKWYDGGRLKNKQNVFDDFQYAAKWLISSGVTSREKLAINGGSNGGLLVCACINQAPELFACAVADVGVLDMTRFHKFTIGKAWTSDYGNPDDEAEFADLIKYSPLHNIQTEKPYPATLLTTSDHDDRVVPLHTLKYVAELQDKAGHLTDKPLIVRVDVKAGHGAGKPTAKRIEEASDKFSFIGLALGCGWIDD